MPSTIPAVKKALRNWLRLQSGLTPTDGVTIHGAPRAPTGADTITLGRVVAPQTPPVMWPDVREETATLTGYVDIRRPGVDDAAEDAARDRAYALLAVLEAALEADPTAGGVIPGPVKGLLTETELTEGEGDESEQAVRWASIRWLLSWTSDY